MSLHFLEGLGQTRTLTQFAGLLGGCCQLLGGDGLVALYAQFSTQRTGLFNCLLYPLLSHYLYPAVFLAMFFGWETNCFPAFLPALLALVVAAYSAGLNALIAFSGKYRSPVSDDRLPDFVRHFCAVQSLRDCCGAFNLDNLRQQPCISWLLTVLSSLTTDLRQCLGSLRL